MSSGINLNARQPRRLRLLTTLSGGFAGAVLALALVGFAPFWVGEAPAAPMQLAATQPNQEIPAAARDEAEADAGASADLAERAPARTVRRVNVRRGDTLMGLMVRAGIDRREAHEAITALRQHYNPRRMMPGQEVTLTFDRDDGAPRLLDVAVATSAEADVVARRTPDGGFVAAPMRLAALRADEDVAAVTSDRAAPDAGAALAEDAPAAAVRRVSVRRGDTLMGLMVRAGIDRREAHEAITALRTHYDPRRIKPGQEIALTFDDGDGAPRLRDVSVAASVETHVIARRTDAGSFKAQAVERPLARRDQRASGVIDGSLYMAAQRAGVPMPVLVELVRLYSFDIDFQRDIQPGDAFEVLFETFADESGETVKYGDVLFARMRLSGQELVLYRFAMDDGTVDYFNAKGESVRKALMKTPIDGARLSSRYGMRRHPILGYSRMHRGIDFAAPRGTPIMAAGRGVIEQAGRNGAYGKYIRIRHNSEYRTAYAHLSRFAKGIRRGARVRQGQIIGYVGSTGRSTGPHLHYEIHRGGRQVNPIGVKLPTGRTLAGAELKQFRQARAEIETRLAALSGERKLARGD